MSESKKVWEDLKKLISMVPDDRGWMIQEKLLEGAKLFGDCRFNEGWDAGREGYEDRS